MQISMQSLRRNIEGKPTRGATAMNDISGIHRTRTVQWDDPAATAGQGAKLAGIDYMCAVAAGELPPPPIAVLLGMGIDNIEPGRVTFSCDPQEFHCNPMGIVHGGLAATLIDSAAGCAAHTTLAAGDLYGTIDLNVTYVKAIVPGSGRLLCTGEVVHAGGSIVTANARLAGGDGSLYAYGHATMSVRRAR
jgi:uncharacterized protein (TIGR00369 family)